MRPLIELIHACPEPPDCPAEAFQLPVTSITCDSRQAVPGALFAALRGVASDGTQYVAQAQAGGAAAVLCDVDAKINAPGMAIIRSQNPRRDLAFMAAAFYSRQPKHVVAVTGTDGKTSTADFFRQFMHGMGQKTASVGTLGILSGDGQLLYPGQHTTPDPVALHRMLSEMADGHVDYVAMEASSHGLDQHRLDGVLLDAAAFTNIARDHLDYHKDEQAYFEAKRRLFSEVLPEGRTVAINADDVRFDELKAICERRRQRVIGFGRAANADFKMISLTPGSYGQVAQLELFGKAYRLDIPLVGAFQVMNILAALGLVHGCGGAIDEALAVVPKLTGVPGRLEQVARLANGAVVFIDYAHTPMALANILKTLRPHTKSRLHVVFGCGGDRDPGKRPQMGAAAAELADIAIVTDDNPRSENPALIRKAVLQAAPNAKEVAERREAIYVALKGLDAGDILVIAGKGHEKTQIIGDKAYPFDDAQVTQELVRELKLAA